jgi:hypothetical protein
MAGRKFDLGIVTVLISVALFVGSAVWVAHSESARINSRMDATEKRLAGLETAIRILSETQSKPMVRNLVNHTLAVSEKAQRMPEARTERKPAGPVRVAPKAKGKD